MIGYFYAIAAYLIWGFLPLYWNLLDSLSSFSLLFFRVAWSLVTAAAVMLFLRKKFKITFGGLKRHFGFIVLTGLLLAGNWLIFLYALSSGHLQDASLGYYINPLVSIFLGMILFKEKLDRLEIIALLLALAGVIWLTVELGRFPWISVLLAGSFATYGFAKKRVPLQVIPTLTIEMAVVLPVLLLLSLFINTGLSLPATPVVLISILAGPFTILPLLFFSLAAKSIPLSAMGFLQFIAPTLMLIISVFVFKEGFPLNKLPAFIMVWAALVMYSLVQFRKMRK